MNFSKIKAFCENDDALYKNVIETYLTTISNDIALLTTAIDNNNKTEIKSLAHKLKGFAVTIDAANYTAHLTALEQGNISGKQSKTELLKEWYIIEQKIREEIEK